MLGCCIILLMSLLGISGIFSYDAVYSHQNYEHSLKIEQFSVRDIQNPVKGANVKRIMPTDTAGSTRIRLHETFLI
jgi:hypothetical protein